MSLSVIRAVSSRGPAVELLDDPRGHGRGIGEVDAGEPVLRLQQLRVRVQGPAALPVSQDSLARREREQRAGADRLRGGGMAGVAVEQEGLDERDADVLGGGVGEQRTDPRPRAVGADQQARDDGGAVGEGAPRGGRRRGPARR